MLWFTIPGRGGSRPPAPPPPPPPPIVAPPPVAAASGANRDKQKSLRRKTGLGGSSAGSVRAAALSPAQTTNKTLLGN